LHRSEDRSLQRIVSTIIKAGYQIDEDAFQLLRKISEGKTVEDLEDVVRDVIREIDALPERPLFISRLLLEEKLRRVIPELKETEELAIRTGKGLPKFYAKEVEADLEVVEDPTNQIASTGSLKDYMEYFQDRFRRLSRLLRQRMDVKDATSVSDAIKTTQGSKVKFVCMIRGKRETEKGIFLEVEDFEGEATVYVPSGSGETINKARNLILDQVICIQAVKGKSDLLIAEDILMPDIPLRKPNKAPLPVYAALISDMHVGSKMFMEDEFKRFSAWLNGRFGDRRLTEIAGHVKYLIITGDIVDGVGVYPQQFDELEIKDIYEQYKVAAEFLEQTPDHIEIIIIPGNHDAVRRALPQPAIKAEYVEPLQELGRVHLLGNPSMILLHGVRVLLYHGRSLDDVTSLLPNMSFQEPEKAMRFLLQSRHLAPAYGERTPISPEKRDFLVIEDVPDIFHAGHVHRLGYINYRGTLIVNSGAWQEQTEYQREMGHTPNPGIVPVVNLQTLEVTSIDFTSRWS